MKKQIQRILCGALVLILLAGMITTVASADSSTDKLMAYKAYKLFLTELKNRKETYVNGVMLYDMPLYRPADFPNANYHTKYLLDYIGNVHLLDYNNDGLEDLWFTYRIKADSTERTYGGIYTYKDGKFTKLANEWKGDYLLKGNDGNVYLASSLPLVGGYVYIYGYINGTFETVAVANMLYVPDRWNGLELPYGTTYYYFNDVEVSYNQYLSMWEKYNGQGTTPIGNDYIDNILRDLEPLISNEELNRGSGFTDVASTDYYAKPVLWAKSKNITGGIGNGMFGSANPCTRAQVVTFLWAANGKPEPSSTNNPFTDVPNDAWYLKSVLWAVERDITGGTSPTTFSPDAECTRAQIVTFLYANAGKPYVDTFGSEFIDVSSSDWFIKPVLWAKTKGVTGGTGPDTFSPMNVCTRAQVVTFLYKAFDGASDPIESVTPPDPVVVVTPEPTPSPTPPARVELVSEAQNYSAPPTPINAVQELGYFSGGAVRAYEKEVKGFCDYSAIDDKTLEAYSALLCANGFTATEPYKSSISGTTRESWGFIYNNGANMETRKQIYAEDQVHMYLCRETSKSGFVTCKLWISKDLNICDLGYRMNGSRVSLEPKGPSLEQGLWKMADGSYQTNDGRLTATPGSSVVLHNGETFKIAAVAKAEYITGIEHTKITVDQYQSENCLSIILDESDDLVSNMLYYTQDLDEDGGCHVISDFGGKTINSIALTFTSINLRVMHIDSQNIVVYFYAEAPGDTIEALICAKRS